MEDLAIMVDSISKRYSACGARIGCLISRNKKFISSATKFAQARLCPPTIDQLAANAAIDIEEEYFKGIIQEYDERRNLVFEELPDALFQGLLPLVTSVLTACGKEGCFY